MEALEQFYIKPKVDIKDKKDIHHYYNWSIKANP